MITLSTTTTYYLSGRMQHGRTPTLQIHNYTFPVYTVLIIHEWIDPNQPRTWCKHSDATARQFTFNKGSNHMKMYLISALCYLGIIYCVQVLHLSGVELSEN